MNDEMDDDWDEEMELEAQAEMFACLESNEYRAFIQMSRDGNSVSEFLTTFEAYGAKAMEPYFAAGRTSAIAKAEIGDMFELADLVRKGKVLNKEEREFTEALILGSLKLNRGARPKRELSKAISLAYFWVFEIEMKGRRGYQKEAVFQCGKLFGLHKTQIGEHVKRGKACELTQERIAMYRTALESGDLSISNYFKKIDLKSG